jgi:glycosyltransferase involved in cell wall biosynthesis
VNKKKSRIVIVGAFPPPTHGMAVVNKAIIDQLRLADASPLMIDVAATELDRRFLARLSRLPKVLHAIVCLASMRGLRGAKLYMSVSGGLGQIYEIFFASLARLRGMRLFMHHHSFSYINMRSTFTKLLMTAAGSESLHVTLSELMAKRLQLIYKTPQTISISNAVFCFRKEISFNKSYKELRTIGFISNISAEKGVFEFLDLMTAIKARKLYIKAKLAGSFQDKKVEQAVNMRLAKMQEVEYVGPKCGAEKDKFFDNIDVFVFPTRYENEAEPLIVLEALSHGVPIIAYGRGCIPEIVGDECGLVIDTNEDFSPGALEQIKAWLGNPQSYDAASKAAIHRFLKTYSRNKKRWLEVMNILLDRSIYTLER